MTCLFLRCCLLKTVYYVGFYGIDQANKHRSVLENPAATVKMNFIVSCLKELGYKVIVVCITYDYMQGFHGYKRIIVSDYEEYVYIPYFYVKSKGKSKGFKSTSKLMLTLYLLRHLRKGTILLTYHTLLYGQLYKRIHSKTKCRWISQVEELYCLSRGDCFDRTALQNEESFFIDSDAFLFVNDILPQKYAGKKPYAVSYGTYSFFEGERKLDKEYINVTYTGVINEDRGVFHLLDAFEYLPMNYRLNILGFGVESEIERMIKKIENINEKSGYNRIIFHGTKMGKEYDDFLLMNQIGVSLMDTSEDISQNAFPSKIMAYLSHSMYVVSSKCKCIVESKVADYLTFCDNDARDISRAILSIDIQKDYSLKTEMERLRTHFCSELLNTLESGVS